jgi:hypothetical protein
MLYYVIHFLHVVGALGMAAAYAVEAAGLIGLRRSRKGAEARLWLRTRRWMLVLGPPSLGLVLASGIYSIVAGWGWRGWIVASLVGLMAMAVLGGVLTGIPMARMATNIENMVEPLPEELRRGLLAQRLTISLALRIAIMLGVVFLMVRKPEAMPAAIVMAAAAAFGVAAGWALGRRAAG